MEYSKKIDESKLNNITNNIDTLLKNVYERKISIEDLFSNINESYDLSYLVFNTIKEDDIIKSFSTLIKKKLGKKKLKQTPQKTSLIFIIQWLLKLIILKQTFTSSKYSK